MSDAMPAADLSILRRRSEILQTVRNFFLERDYWEAQTPTLCSESVVDAWLDPLVVPVPGQIQPRFLQTSPELNLKRLLAAGAKRVFQIGSVFREGERGRLHNPEFTMVEWYAIGESYHEQMDLVTELLRVVFERHSGSAKKTSHVMQSAERLTFDEVFTRQFGLPVLGLQTSELRKLAADHALSVPEGLSAEDRDGWLNLLLAECVEPELGTVCPTFVYDYPASQAALARIRTGDPCVAERFELYIDAIELCNGYQELTDAGELLDRSHAQNVIRRGSGRAPLKPPSQLIQAMEHGLPDCAGVALGFDRLVMVALGLDRVDEVLAFPWERS